MQFPQQFVLIGFFCTTILAGVVYSTTKIQAQLTACDADINRSGRVDISDYSVLVANFFLRPPNVARADITGDGFVDLRDYTQLVTHFFRECISASPIPTGVANRIEAENMQKAGPYVGVISTPFAGMALYGNSDTLFASHSFTPIPGAYQILVRGASSNTNPAGVSIYVGSTQVAALIFNSTTPVSQVNSFILNSTPNPSQVKLVLETDTGQSDTLIDYIELSYQGAVPTPLPTPVVPSQGAVETGQYRNMFKEIGKSDPQIEAKLNATFNSLFYGANDGNKDNPNNEAIYKTVGTDMAFIEDINNGDIRTEGISYGMMIAVQMNKKAEFDRLWKFAKTYMRCPRTNQCPVGSGLDGYFSWQMRASAPYDAIDPNPAPDGEEYYATALIFASGRWGNNGEHNYSQDAQAVLDAMLNDTRPNSVRSMFNLQKKVIVFSPMGSSASYSDPSYHLPAFYEVWARFDQRPSQRAFWSDAAVTSRAYWKVASGYNVGRTNGLMPDCTDLNGIATYGCAGGAIYAYDSWRSIANVAVDYAWWAKDPWLVTQANNLQNFFGPKRPSYNNLWNLDGTTAGGSQNSTGQIAMNGVASLASNNQYTNGFVQDVWNLPPAKGRYRYYDGLLHMMALQHLSGNFKVY